MRNPTGDLRLIPLHRATLGPLQTPAESASQQAPDRRPRQRHPCHPLHHHSDPLQGPQIGLEAMRLGALLQRGPHLLYLGVVQLRPATGCRLSPQGLSSTDLPSTPPAPHTLRVYPHHQRDVGVRETLPEQLDRTNTPSLRQLRPRQRRNMRTGHHGRRLIRHGTRLPPTEPSPPTEPTKRSVGRVSKTLLDPLHHSGQGRPGPQPSDCSARATAVTIRRAGPNGRLRTIAAIGRRWGFVDATHFSKVFKQVLRTLASSACGRGPEAGRPAEGTARRRVHRAR